MVDCLQRHLADWLISISKVNVATTEEGDVTSKAEEHKPQRVEPSSMKTVRTLMLTARHGSAAESFLTAVTMNASFIRSRERR